MKPTRIISVIILTSFYLIMTPHAVSNSRKESSGSDLLRVTDLRCEYLVNPLGIDELRPRLGWRFESDQRGQKQTAYQLLVASSPEKLKRNNGDLWDTGKVQSDQSIHHIYAGKPMESGMHSYWKVMVWDKDGKLSAWSEQAEWSMGLLNESDWKGSEWIGIKAVDIPKGENRPLAARYLRREFKVNKKVKHATAFVCGLGFFDLFINGKEVENDLMQPGLTRYDRRSLYVTYDITKYIKSGDNAVGAILGNGRFFAPRLTKPARFVDFGHPKMLFQMHLEYEDGSKDTIFSGPGWKITDQGPIRANNEYDGEIYDARMEMPGWSEPGFNDNEWKAADTVSAPGGRLEAQMIEPIRIIRQIIPVSVEPLEKGGYIVDMGQVFYGNVRIKVCGPAGTKITLTSAYSLNQDGSLRVRDNRAAKCTDNYILKGKGIETWSPRFKGQGFRRVWVSGWPGKPTVDNFTGQVLCMDIPLGGEFFCSDDLINKIYSNIRQTQQMYLRTVPMDPDRDERQGWIGDQNQNIHSYSYSWNVYPLFSKWLGDLRLDQKENGHLPVVTPAFWEFYNKSMLWPSGITLIPELLRQQYDDSQAIRDNYTVMDKWMAFLESKIDNEGILPLGEFGDWCDVASTKTNGHRGKTPIPLLATAYYYRHCLLMEQFALMQNLSSDAKRYRQIGKRTKTAFNKKFFNEQNGQYQTDTQCAYAVAIMLDLVPEAHFQRATQNFVESIIKDAGGHPSVGMVGMQWLFQALDKVSRNDVALNMLQKTTFPSWGYMVSKGATSIWEKWNSDKAGPGMNSEGLLFLGGNINAWLFESIAGIRPDTTKPGFKHVIMKPYTSGNLTCANASYKSMYGRIVSDWKIGDGFFSWKVIVPPNSTATVYVPGKEITEGGFPAAKVEGVTFVRLDQDKAVFKVESGMYVFKSIVK